MRKREGATFRFDEREIAIVGAYAGDEAAKKGRRTRGELF